ncbi:toll/interleukin-1 receptor domain-containing protein [Planctellipticum variicoloris]|uniref:toll/interleukin-1 receptor domain-containing protein n=1 Tax=Planctellipticum variicoloris TaxID=3064265 RepID=UPI003013DCBF|nr:toll/interleukin-1 receptor domain-containing protein [Planctomycetaceae bacterium SH412]
MAKLTFIERKKLETLLEMGGGYVLDFSNRTFHEFVADSVGLEIYDQKYRYGSGSKANCLRGFIEVESDVNVSKLIRDLVEYAAEVRRDADPELVAACNAISDRLNRATNSSPSGNRTAPAAMPVSNEQRIRTFISYSWDNESHKDWTRGFADALVTNGIETILDQYDLRPGEDRFQFMEASVRDADAVLCVCTPAYVLKANSRSSGVGIETSLLSPQFYERMRTAKQFIPIIRESDGASHTPDYLSPLIFIDFRIDSEFGSRMEELLRLLHGQPKHRKPTIGPRPNFM